MRRQRLIELRRQLNKNKEENNKTTMKLLDSKKTDFSSKFELPISNNKLIKFSLTNGAKITNYKWIGIYDQCLKVIFKNIYKIKKNFKEAHFTCFFI